VTVLKAAWLVLVSGGAVGLSRALMGADGTRGALLGVGFGAVLCLVNFFITRKVRQADGPNVKLVMVGIIASFWLLISFVLLVNYLVPPLVKPAALTVLAIYLAYRGAEVLELGLSSGPSGRSSDRSSGVSRGGPPRNGRLSLSTLSGTTEAGSGKETR
jgi:hypothetical protein